MKFYIDAYYYNGKSENEVHEASIKKDELNVFTFMEMCEQIAIKMGYTPEEINLHYVKKMASLNN